MSFAVESWKSLKTRMLYQFTKKKEDRMCEIAIRNAGMKQNDIARVLNVSQVVVNRPLKEHRESGSITKRKRSTLIPECKELLLSILVRGALSDDHLIQLKGVIGTLDAQKYQDKIMESGVRPPLESLDGQNRVLQDDLQELTVLASSRNTKINRTSLVFYGRACCWT